MGGGENGWVGLANGTAIAAERCGETGVGFRVSTPIPARRAGQ